MDYKLALEGALVLFIVSCGWLMPEHGQYILWGTLLSSVFLFCFDYAREKLRGISLKETLERWMSNVIQGTGVTIQSFFLMLLGLIPILIKVYLSSLLIFYLVCLALLWWIFSCLWRHIQHKYLVNIHPWVMVNIHPWVMSVVNWIKGICDETREMILYFIIGLLTALFFGVTLNGFLSWMFVIVHSINVDVSKSMGVRNSTIHLDIMLKFDNFTCSSNNLVVVYSELGMLHTDLSELTENYNMTPTEILISGSWMYVTKWMQDAKHGVGMNQMHLKFMVGFIKEWMPELEPFKRQIIYFPYFIGFYRFRSRVKWVVNTFCMPLLRVFCVWLLWLRYMEHGLFGAIFHWNTCRNGIIIYVVRRMWKKYASWETEQKAASQELEHATSQPHATQTRNVRGKSPGARRAS